MSPVFVPPGRCGLCHRDIVERQQRGVAIHVSEAAGAGGLWFCGWGCVARFAAEARP